MAKLRGAPRSPKEHPCISLTAAALLHAVVPPDQAMPRGSLRATRIRGLGLKKKKKKESGENGKRVASVAGFASLSWKLRSGDPKLISLRPFRRGEALPQGGERMGVRGPRGAAMDLPSPHPPRSSAGPLRAQPPLPTPRPPTFRAYRGALRRGAPEERPTPGPGPKGGRPGARCGARLPSQVNAEAEIPFAITFNHNRSFYLRA